MSNVDDMIEIAKEILALNGDCSITGTLMLHLRGIRLWRDIGDIDILCRGESDKITLPEGAMMIKNSVTYNGSGCKIAYRGYLIDILSEGEEPQMVDGVKLGTIQCMLKAKTLYSKQSNNVVFKHKNDLCMLKAMGYVYKEEIEEAEVYESDDLPF